MNIKNITDHFGIVAACVCVFHCVALPVLLVTSAMAENDTFHIWSLIATILITGHALWHGYREHCKHIVLSLGGLGILTLVGGVVLHFMFHDHGVQVIQHGDHFHTVGEHSLVAEYGEQAVTIIGSILLIASHLYNLKFKRNCCTK